MLKLNLLITFLIVSCLLRQDLYAQHAYQYVSFPDDPLNTRIYTLDNGLKVYLSVCRKQPLIQTFVSIKAGSKHDPESNTGLAHYLEHLMFKGTTKFGTINWEKEKPLLDKIEQLYERRRLESDEPKRNRLYEEIDSLSYLASKYAIPNEYVKLMSAIGSLRSNANTSIDHTTFVETIPANQLHNWAEIQALRFSDPVFRLFHTELESVYEEYNMSVSSEMWQAIRAISAALMPQNPSLTRPTLGHLDDLKNPSITDVKRFYEEYYVPNNMAIIMVGDFDYDEVVHLIDKHFGHMKPGAAPEFTVKPEQPISKPAVQNFKGEGPSFVQIGYLFEGASSDQIPYLNLIMKILFNGQSGLIDQNINMQRITHGTSVLQQVREDFSILHLIARNKDGQSLKEVQELLLEQVNILKSGDWPDWIMEAAVNQMIMEHNRQLNCFYTRTREVAKSFTLSIPYKKNINYVDRIRAITKDDIIDFANKHFPDNNYAVVHKEQVDELEIERLTKPEITPIRINRDITSDFFQYIERGKTPPIQPVFLNFEEDLLQVYMPNGTELLYVQDTGAPTFQLRIEWELGQSYDASLPLAGEYLEAAGTNKRSAAEINQKLYVLAGDFTLEINTHASHLQISGSSVNFDAIMALVQEVIWEPERNNDLLTQITSNVKKQRRLNKSRDLTLLKAIADYATFGPVNPTTNTLSDAELEAISAQELIDLLQQLHGFKPKVLYAGPHHFEEVIAAVKHYQRPVKDLKPVPRQIKFVPIDRAENIVYFTHINSNQSLLQTIFKSAIHTPENLPIVNVYSRYFAGNMDAIMFQELREKQGLAYMVGSYFSTPESLNESYINTSLIVTQNDKVFEALNALNELHNDLPLSETTLYVAKEQILSTMRTERMHGFDVIKAFKKASLLGQTTDSRELLYHATPDITLMDLKEFNAQYIRQQSKIITILGNKNMIDFDALEQHFGPVHHLSIEELLNY